MSSQFNTQDPKDLLWGSNASLAEYLGVSIATVKRFKAAPDRMPSYAVRLLKLRYGDLSGLLDASWEGFSFRQGELFTPEFKYGFSAQEMRAWFFERQELRALRKENQELRYKVATLQTAAVKQWAADKVRSTYIVKLTGCADSEGVTKK